jgi:hypothetical protein
MLAAMAGKSCSQSAIKHMQQTAKTWRHGPRAPGFAITQAEYISLARFSNDAEKLDVKSTGLTKSLFGSGVCLKLAGKSAQYEVHVRDGQLLVGKVEATGKRSGWLKLPAHKPVGESFWPYSKTMKGTLDEMPIEN